MVRLAAHKAKLAKALPGGAERPTLSPLTAADGANGLQDQNGSHIPLPLLIVCDIRGLV